MITIDYWLFIILVLLATPSAIFLILLPIVFTMLYVSDKVEEKMVEKEKELRNRDE